MSIQSDVPGPVLFLLSCLLLAGAAAIAWYGALATMHLTRIDAHSVRVDLDRRVLGLMSIQSTRIDGVRSAALLSNRAPDAPSQRGTDTLRLMLLTADGPQDSGHAQQHFVDAYTTIRDFIKESSGRELKLTSADDFNDMLRFGAAQLSVLVLAALAFLLLWLASRSMFPDPNAGIGQR